MNPYLRICRLILISSILFSLHPGFGHAAQNRHDPAILMVVKVSPTATYSTQTEFRSRSVYKELSQISEGLIAPLTLISDTIIHFHLNNGIREYEVTADGIVFNREKQLVYPLSKKATDELKEEVRKLRHQHFGELISWDELKTKIPKFAKFSITDIETGLVYEVQRRAGSSHIDAQPLTKQDSDIMKKIYSGKWSWNRRAVLIKYKEGTWAGSINGMPHGGDGIPDNRFDGHFCIHFEGSRTHKNNKLDLAHQVMNYKAAGRLEQLTERLSPGQLADLWVNAINQQDQAILRASTWLGNPAFTEQMNKITSAASASTQVRSKKKSKQAKKIQGNQYYLTANVPVKATYSLPNSKQTKGMLQLRIIRTSPMDRWVIYQIEK